MAGEAVTLSMHAFAATLIRTRMGPWQPAVSCSIFMPRHASALAVTHTPFAVYSTESRSACLHACVAGSTACFSVMQIARQEALT